MMLKRLINWIIHAFQAVLRSVIRAVARSKSILLIREQETEASEGN